MSHAPEAGSGPAGAGTGPDWEQPGATGGGAGDGGAAAADGAAGRTSADASGRDGALAVAAGPPGASDEPLAARPAGDAGDEPDAAYWERPGVVRFRHLAIAYLVKRRAMDAGHNSLFNIMRFLAFRRKSYIYVEPRSGVLSTKIKLSYCAPTFSTLPIVTLLAVYIISFYEKLGADLAYMSFFIALARCIDVISDPAMSYITDSWRSKHGRRRPFCFTGCWPYALFLILLLSPPDLASTAISVWFGVFYILFFLLNTYTNIPYDALGPELTDNYDDRSRLFFVSGLFDGFGALVAMIIPAGLSVTIANTTECEYLEDCTGQNGAAGDFLSVARSCKADPDTGETETWDISNDWLGITEDNWQEFYNDDACPLNTTAGPNYLEWGAPEGVFNFCECKESCESWCKLDYDRQAFQLVGIFFGLWYIITMCNCCYQIKERASAQNHAPPPIVPSLLNTFNNRPFVTLLPAWVCDAVFNGVVASMMVYFVRYVVQPEVTCTEDQKAEDAWQCDSTSWLAISVTSLLVCAFLSTPLWLVVTKLMGKRNAWLLWSFVNGSTNILFLAVGPGDMIMCVCIASLNGVAFGAKFLADAVLADIIDYDEFLNGTRSEATFTMFKSFLPKMVAIPAAAVPIALLNTVGHVSPVDGRVQVQPDSVYTFVQIVAVVFPSAIAFVALYLKTRFPLHTREQINDIAAGIGKHMLKKPAVDPISGHEFAIVELTDEQQRVAFQLDNFPGVATIDLLEEDGGAATLLARAVKQRNVASLCFVSALLAAILTFPVLENDSLSFIPVLCIISFGVSLVFFAFALLRLQAAERIHKMDLDPALLRLVREQRTHWAKCNAKPVSGVAPAASPTSPTADATAAASSTSGRKVVPAAST